MTAAKLGNTDIVHTLLATNTVNADITDTVSSISIAPTAACSSVCCAERQNCTDVGQSAWLDDDGQSAVGQQQSQCQLARSGEKCIRFLLKLVFNVCDTQHGDTALILASRLGHVQAVEALLRVTNTRINAYSVRIAVHYFCVVLTISQ